MFGKIGASGFSKTKARLGKAASIMGQKTKRGAVKGMKLGGTYLADVAVQGLGKTMKSTANIASSLLREDRANSLLGYRLKKRGIALAVGIGALSAAKKETKAYFKEDLVGRKDGYITPHAPTMNSVGSGYGNYGVQAGATGDLVFALNNNRKG